MSGPVTVAGLRTLQWKYCQEGETYRDVCNRVAGSISDNPDHFRCFRDILLECRFVPGGRILASLGTTKRVTSYNCFVSGTIADSLNGPGSIMGRLAEGARTMQMGGGIGYDFSTLRPRGDAVRSVEGRASGPVSYIKVYDAMGKTVSSAGERRGAQMGILRVDHPDIEEFILAKQNKTDFGCFNFSVAVTDEFMEAVEADGDFNLRFEGRTYRAVRARTLWDLIMRGTWDWAEPGVVFIDRINKLNNLNYCETIAATNPCSEQPLPPFGACLLGSFNLTKYLMPRRGPAELDSRFEFNYAMLMEDVGQVVRAMDNVIDVSIYPLEEQKQQALHTRRMGLGVMGLANAIEAMGHPYGSDDFIYTMSVILGDIKSAAYEASALLAREKGAFPLYKAEYYLENQSVKTLPQSVRDKIALYRMRNSHLTTIAPTGTTAFAMDNVSSGIEPVFAQREIRKVKGPDGDVECDVVDFGTAVLGVKPKGALEVTAEEHIAVLATAQRYVDSAISKTCNVPPTMPWDSFKALYHNAWMSGAKGCATYQAEGMREGVRKEVKGANDMQREMCVSGSCDL